MIMVNLSKKNMIVEQYKTLINTSSAIDFTDMPSQKVQLTNRSEQKPWNLRQMLTRINMETSFIFH